LRCPPSLVVSGAGPRVALAAVGPVLALGGGGGSTSPSATGGRASAGWVTGCPPSGSPAACITSATLQGDRLAVDFRSQDLDQATSTFNGQPGTVFFLANLSQDQAGGVIARTSNWRPWGQVSPFSG